MSEVLHVSPDGVQNCSLCGVTIFGKSYAKTVERRDGIIEGSIGGYWEACQMTKKVDDDFNTTAIVVNDPFLRELLRECIKTLDTKGADYTAGNIEEDRLHNFRTAAAETAVSMEKVWYVYFYKHLSSIKRFVRDGYVESEPLRGRVIDLINYLYLLLRIEEEKTAGKK